MNRQPLHARGSRFVLLPLIFLAVFIAGGCARSTNAPVRDCGIRCVHRLAAIEGWPDERVDTVDEFRHAREQERGYNAFEILAILRASGVNAATERIDEPGLWTMAEGGAKPLVLVQDDVYARLFPNEYHWILVEGIDAQRERYRVYLADESGDLAWWPRSRMARYQARAQGIVVVPESEQVP